MPKVELKGITPKEVSDLSSIRDYPLKEGEVTTQDLWNALKEQRKNTRNAASHYST